MKCTTGMMIILISGVAALHAAIDSSTIIFNDTKIHQYDLHFYCTNWEDSLVYYKSLPDEEYIPARLLYRTSPTDSVVLDSVGVRYKGNSSYAFAGKSPKKPFKFSFDRFGADRRFFGVRKLNFSNGAMDPTMMREKISYDILARYMAAPRAAFATISIDGMQIGLYTQVEQVDKTFLSAHFDKSKGNLFKSSDNGSTLLYKDANQSSYAGEYELKTNEDANDWRSLVKMLYYVNTSDSADFMDEAGSVINLDNVCRYLAFNMVFSNFDSYTGSGRNFYLYEDPSTSRFVVIPWDLNLAFGAFTNSWNVITNDIIAVTNLDDRPLNRRIIGHDSLRQVYLGYIRELLNGPASADSIALRASVIRPLIDSAVRCDSNKLHSYSEFSANIDSSVSVVNGFTRSIIPGLGSFCTRRAESLRSQLDTYGASVRRVPAVPSAPAHNLAFRTSRHDGVVFMRYSLARGSTGMRIDLYTMAGKQLRSISLGPRNAGDHEETVSIASIGTGCFLCKLTCSNSASLPCAVVPVVLR